MVTGFDGRRLLAMVPQEQRWLNNLKKAFYASDVAVAGGNSADKAFPEICTAIDVAAMLRRPAAPWVARIVRNNKQKFIEFLHLEIPDADANGVDIPLLDRQTHNSVRYNFDGIFYAIRCMIHENENLNVDENPDYHVMLDWRMQSQWGSVCDGHLTCNANLLWWCIREVLAKFILGIEVFMAHERGDPSFSMHCRPALKSIHPNDRRHTTTAVT